MFVGFVALMFVGGCVDVWLLGVVGLFDISFRVACVVGYRLVGLF